MNGRRSIPSPKRSIQPWSNDSPQPMRAYGSAPKNAVRRPNGRSSSRRSGSSSWSNALSHEPRQRTSRFARPTVSRENFAPRLIRRQHSPNGDQQRILEQLRAAQAAIAPKLHELRELDEWKRFANAAVQEELIAKTEALRTKYGFDTPEGAKPEDVEKAARELHEIQERWKQAAEAPRAQAQALWHRYRQAADPIQAKARQYFAQRVEERKGNLERKLALIEQAEALAQSSDWIKTAEELKKLQAEWQAIGPVPRQDTRTTWKRFRDACDTFFTRRNADLAQRKETWAANQAKKEALCVRAEELATSMEWERGAAEIRRLQAEWKTIGPVRRTKSEALWQRFRAACDTFFDRYKRRDQIELEARQADREGLVAELESLVPVAATEATEVQAGDAAAAAEPELRRDGGRLRRVARTGAVAPEPVEPVDAGRPPGRRSAERALHGRARTAAGGLPRRVPRDRTRHRSQSPEDGEALRTRRRLPERRRGNPRELVAGARGDAARGAGVEHDWRPCRGRNQVASNGGRRSRRAGGVEPPRPGARRCRPPARGSFPSRVQPVLRTVSAAHAATGAGGSAGQAGRGALVSRRGTGQRFENGGELISTVDRRHRRIRDRAVQDDPFSVFRDADIGAAKQRRQRDAEQLARGARIRGESG